jgi:hypothetical protein
VGRIFHWARIWQVEIPRNESGNQAKVGYTAEHLFSKSLALYRSDINQTIPHSAWQIAVITSRNNYILILFKLQK